MRNIEILYAKVVCDGRIYIYSPDGKPAGVKTGEPYCSNPNLNLEILAALDAAHLYPLEEPCEIAVRRSESIVKP